MTSSNDRRLFLACFIALVSTSFVFMIRIMILDDLAKQFEFSETQKGELFGVGLWPFAVSIVLFSLIIDKVGYGKAMVFAFFCHLAFIVITVLAPRVLAAPDAGAEAIALGKERAYWILYLANFIAALGNGTVEAVINPIVATMFSREKTKWLNILHAGWPGGLVLAGVLTIGIAYLRGNNQLPETGLADWQLKVLLLALPVVLYGLLMATCSFPVNERVAAGVSYRQMLQEVGFLGALLVTTLLTFEISRVLEGLDLIFTDKSPILSGEKHWNQIVQTVSLPWFGDVAISLKLAVKLGVIFGISLLFGLAVLSLGRFLFFFLMLIMIPLAITELGTDSWITDLMKPAMAELGFDAGWILVYTSFIMMVLRFFAGPIVHALSPLGLLALSSAIAVVGLVSLSLTQGLMILGAATLYGFGKTFFWPTMLGVVAEQFPKGGALTLNSISGVGMIGAGILGTALLGNIQDIEVRKQLPAEQAGLFAPPRQSIFGEYQPLDAEKVAAQPKEIQALVKDAQTAAKKSALKWIALFPAGMLVAYLLLMGYFAARGGYKPVELTGASPGH